MPDKAIDVIDEAGAYQRLQPEEKRVKRIEVAQVEDIVAKIARIPPKHVTTSDKELLRNLERDLKLTVFGQDDAIESLSTAIKLSRAGLKAPDKPVGSFLFAGPTGVGKTEVARQLAKALGVELVRFDMSEYMERHTVSRLIGAPPGYVGFDQGGLLTEAITKTPHCVLLLDEIEKAHPEVFNLLLQVMDHGTLTDNNGRKADFRNIILIMTTNAGAEVAARASIGFNQQDHTTDAMEVIKKSFTPEFRNRLDKMCIRDRHCPSASRLRVRGSYSSANSKLPCLTNSANSLRASSSASHWQRFSRCNASAEQTSFSSSLSWPGRSTLWPLANSTRPMSLSLIHISHPQRG